MVNIAKRMIEVGALKFGDFVLSSGKKSNVYVDVKLASAYPDILDAITEEIIKKIDVEFDKIACVELGGVPIGVSLSLKTRKPLVIFRKQKKEYGLGDDKIGPITPGDRFVLVEDVITTGKSAISAIERIEKAGGRVVKILAVVDREESEIKFESVLRLSELLKTKDLLQSSQG